MGALCALMCQKWPRIHLRASIPQEPDPRPFGGSPSFQVFGISSFKLNNLKMHYFDKPIGILTKSLVVW